MVTLRAFLALLVGVVTTTMLQIVVSAALKRWTPDWAAADRKSGSGATVVFLGAAFLAAAAGGYVTAWEASGNPLVLVLALGVVLLILSGLSALQIGVKRPAWFLLAQVGIAPLGAVVGGLVRLRVIGVLP